MAKRNRRFKYEPLIGTIFVSILLQIPILNIFLFIHSMENLRKEKKQNQSWINFWVRRKYHDKKINKK